MFAARKRKELDVPSGASTPVFPWSPLPPRRKFGNVQTRDTYKNEDLYPNCDVNVWLRTCEQESIEPIDGTVSGTIPNWLNGSLYRNGPGAIKVGNEEFAHLFDGSALLHRFSIADGTVRYQCRFLQSDIYKKNLEANRIILTEFGTKAVADPCKSIFNRVAAVFNPQECISDNAMISIYPFGDDLYAFGESPIIHRINKENLSVQNRVNFYDKIGTVNHTSHPHVESDGSVYNLAMTYSSKGLAHNIVHFPKDTDSSAMFDKAYITASIATRWRFNPSYMHTFGITKNYFIIVEQPLSLSVASMAKCKFKNDPLIGSLSWYNDETTQFNVICRKTGKCVKQFQAEAFFFLHIINQYEQDDCIVIDICCYRDPAMIDCMYIEVMKNMQHNPDYAKMFRGRPLRFILPLNIAENKIITFPGSRARATVKSDGRVFVKPEKLCNLGCETPRIHNERHLGKIYRYFYAISSDVDAGNPGTIIKVDILRKTCKTWCEENCYPSEPIFVPAPDAQDEDDGVVLAAMVWGNGETHRAGLIILDAKTFTEIARAEFDTPSPVPKCLHGWYLSKT